MDCEGIHLKGKFDSYPHIGCGFVSCPLACYTDITYPSSPGGCMDGEMVLGATPGVDPQVDLFL